MRRLAPDLLAGRASRRVRVAGSRDPAILQSLRRLLCFRVGESPHASFAGFVFHLVCGEAECKVFAKHPCGARLCTWYEATPKSGDFGVRFAKIKFSRGVAGAQPIGCDSVCSARSFLPPHISVIARSRRPERSGAKSKGEATKQSPRWRGDCFATIARNDGVKEAGTSNAWLPPSPPLGSLLTFLLWFPVSQYLLRQIRSWHSAGQIVRAGTGLLRRLVYARPIDPDRHLRGHRPRSLARTNARTPARARKPALSRLRVVHRRRLHERTVLHRLDGGQRAVACPPVARSHPALEICGGRSGGHPRSVCPTAEFHPRHEPAAFYRA